MKIWIGILFTLLLNTSQNVNAAIGTITEQVNSPPSIQRSKSTFQGSKGTGIEMNDSIKTTAGKAGIKFEDNTQVQINENSKLVIDEFVYDPKSNKGGKLAVNVAAGTVRYASGQIGKNNPQSVAVNTPTATIAIRGTDFTTTVDELGRSIIILLPSCPHAWQDIERDCKTGIIDVITDAGLVTLNQPFQATRVDSRSNMPLKPITVNLTEDSINNMLIVSPPKEISKSDEKDKKRDVQINGLDQNFLAANHLTNELEKQQRETYQDKLSKNFLQQDFLMNILDIVNAQLAARQDLLAKSKNALLPDYVASSGVVVTIDDPIIELCRNDGSNTQCVSVPKNQNTTITQIQGSVEISNRVNSGGSTIITLKQN